MLTMAVLAVLGIPLWLIVAALALSYWSRRRFKAGTGVFPCRVRDVPDSGEAVPWGRETTYGRWVHDVLLLHSGVTLARYEALPVAGVERATTPATDTRFDGDAISLLLRLDDGQVMEVAGPARIRHLLEGPFHEAPSAVEAD